MRRPIATLLSLALVAAALVGALPQLAAAAEPTVLGRAAYTPPTLKIGVVQSSLTHDWQARHRKGWSTVIKQQETAEYLQWRGWDVTMLGDADLGNLATLKQYDVVVLPWVFAMNTAPQRVMLRYIAEGGAVVSTIGSPRVAPESETNPNDPNEVWPEHFYKIFAHRAWEWGLLNEAYQTEFINDVGALTYVQSPANLKHPIVTDAQGILRARGYDGNHLVLRRAPADWVELPKLLANDPNVEAVLNMTFTSLPTMSPAYPGTHPSVTASRYGAGRTVYFMESITDYFPTYDYHKLNSIDSGTNTPQGQLAGAYFEAALQWAAQDNTPTAPNVRRARTYGQITAARDGIYVRQYCGNIGNVVNGGTRYIRIWDPVGRLVFSKSQERVSVRPGQEQYFNEKYLPGALLPGKYRIQVEYRTSYVDDFASSHKESAWVTAGQGSGITTMVEGTSKPVLSRTGFSPGVLQRDGDGWAEHGYLNFTLDKPAVVSAYVYNAAGAVVGTLAKGSFRAQGANSLRFVPVSSTGVNLPDGAYTYKLFVQNTAGTTSTSGMVFVSRRMSGAPLLGTVPVLSGVGATPNPFSPNADGVADRSDIVYSLSADAWVTVRIFDSRGEIKTIIYNNKRTAGAHRETWNGRSNAAVMCGNGTYRYYVFAHSGDRRTSSFAWGSVTLKR